MTRCDSGKGLRVGAARLLAVCLSVVATGCAHYGGNPSPDPPTIGPATPTRVKLERLRPPGDRITVAVYGFPDLTGQNRYTPGLTYGDLSKAVTQGGGTVLVDVLRSAGGGGWFKIVERAQVDDLLRERKLIQETYLSMTPAAKNPKAFIKPVLPPIAFADYLFAGGITGYDRVLMTGGIGASYLGIGANVSYQKDIVNVTLRLIDVLTGSVVRSINASKTVYSVNVSADVSRYVTVSNLLELSAGTTSAEPTLLAVREAIELALYELLQECSERPTWCVAKTSSPSRYQPPIRPPLPLTPYG